MADRIWTSMTGIATRRAVFDYLRAVFLILFILLSIAWTIDLADQFNGIRDGAIARGVALYEVLAPYLAYRTADMVTRMLPMACFFGVFLAEIARRSRLETVILITAGASPARMIASVVIFGALVGGLQWKLESHWRPQAVAAQVELGHGGYAGRFAKVWLSTPEWFVSGNTAIRGQVFRNDPPAIRDALIFTGLRAPKLQAIYAADLVEPTGEPMQWSLSGVEFWDAASDSETSIPAPDQIVTLDLIPEQLIHFNVPGFYLPGEALPKLQRIKSDPEAAYGADVAIWRRRLAWLLPGTLALLATCLANTGFSGRQFNVPKLIAVAVFGYACVVSIKVLWAVGELGGLSGLASVSASILFILAVSLWLVRRQA